jgi:hypothetical protein
MPDKIEFFWYDGGNESFAKSLFKKDNGEFLAIGINIRLREPFFRKVAAQKILHEMAHVVCGVEIDCQEVLGPFDLKMLDIVNRGGFVEFW